MSVPKSDLSRLEASTIAAEDAASRRREATSNPVMSGKLTNPRDLGYEIVFGVAIDRDAAERRAKLWSFAGSSMRPGGFEPPTRGLEVRCSVP